MSTDVAGDPAPTGTAGRSVMVDCETGNDYDGRVGLRISSIFVILLGSVLGAVLPIVLSRAKHLKVPDAIFFVAKYFGSGVIVATAFIHLLAPANEALGSPCFGEDSAMATYPWAEGIALITIFIMFFIELIASRYEWSVHGPSGPVPPMNYVSAATKKGGDVETGAADDRHSSNEPSGPSNKAAFGHGSDENLGPHKADMSPDSFAAQMTALFILEFGVIFHSIFIGLTLAVSGDEFTVLYVVLVFHQTFEGLGLGSRLAVAQWPEGKEWLPYALGVGYALSTPIAIAAGLGVRDNLEPTSLTTMAVNGVFDSISAGILIYTGLVELMAHEFMFNSDMRKASMGKMLSAFGFMCLGGGIMALLGRWA